MRWNALLIAEESVLFIYFVFVGGWGFVAVSTVTVQRQWVQEQRCLPELQDAPQLLKFSSLFFLRSGYTTGPFLAMLMKSSLRSIVVFKTESSRMIDLYG